MSRAHGAPGNGVFAVVPVFHPPSSFADRLPHLLGQVDGIVVVDDGSHSVGRLDLVGIPGVVVIESPVNSGIAHALNVACGEAIRRGARFLLTLDQDSDLPGGFVERALSALSQPAAPGVRAGAAVPASVGGAPILRTRRHGRETAFDPIQSGTVIPSDVFREVGAFREELFIDAVDSDYTLRLRGHGLEVVTIADIDLGHALGEAVPIVVAGRPLKLGGRQRHVLHHSPFRTYYMIRNSIDLTRRYRRGNAAWHVRRWQKLSTMVLGSAVLGPDSTEQFRAIRLGVRDGLRGRLGKLPEAALRWIAGSPRG